MKLVDLKTIFTPQLHTITLFQNVETLKFFFQKS